jgi:hypothetical protein
VVDRDPDATVIVPPRITAVLSETAGTAPTQRDRHLQCIADNGRMGWQKASGYSTRSRIETATGRYKQVIGDGLRFHKDGRRDTEARIAVQDTLCVSSSQVRNSSSVVSGRAFTCSRIAI